MEVALMKGKIVQEKKGNVRPLQTIYAHYSCDAHPRLASGAALSPCQQAADGLQYIP